MLIAAPGRLLDLINQGHITLMKSTFRTDECDRLLDMGCIPDVRRIVMPQNVSPVAVVFLQPCPRISCVSANEVLHKPARIDVSPKEITVAKIEQYAVMVANAQKARHLKLYCVMSRCNGR